MSLESYRPTRETVLTAPNVISAIGVTAVWHGANQINSINGVLQIAGGRTLDAVDGLVARKFNQQSDFGAALDASLDKAGVFKILFEARKKEAAPRAFLGALAIRHSINALAGAYSVLENPGVSQRPTKTGKFGMALDNLALFGYLTSNALAKEGHPRNVADKLKTASHLAAVAGMVVGTMGTAEYLKRAMKSKKVIK